ncbi:MAG: FtsX-like permease family protein [Armatimonadetes bacterium]|jgi:putative ABC transport system permease protein|nr:FtsX-like permease family protein [Armatimonadota bacterium]
MNVLESIRVALTGLAANKLRSLLTMLGVIIGVSAVIAMVGIGQGAQQETLERIQSFGTNTLMVMAGEARQGGVRGGMGSSATLVPEDAEAIARIGTPIKAVCPEVGRAAQVKYGNQNTNVSIVGCGESYADVRNHKVARGRFFTEREVASMRRVCTIGTATAATLFGTQNPIGKRIRIAGSSFLVVGVMAEKGSQGWFNPDDQIYIPYTTAMRRVFGIDSLRMITVQVTDISRANLATERITQVLRRRHRLGPGRENDFNIRNQAEFVEAVEATSRTFTLLLAGIASVSLLVGGIGIMNIMLVSVTERTREIGVRKALGARRRDVLLQFMIEAMVLSILGGVVGIGLGVGGSLLLARTAGWTTVIAPHAIALAFTFSAAVGVFFGIYPAHKASRLNPIEALRWE